MINNITYVDILTAIAAMIAAFAAVYTVIIDKKSNQKNNLLDNYTAERLYDLHEMKKWANVLLNEAAIAIHFTKDRQDVEIRITRIIEASNGYRFVLKPIYARDIEVLQSMLDLKDEIINYYKETEESKRKNHIPLLRNKGMHFRKLAFIYAHSSWSCIKNQIMFAEYSQYNEFNKIYASNEAIIKRLIDGGNQEYKNIWYL